MEPYFYHRVKNLNIDTLFKIVDSGYIMPRVMINTTFCDHGNVFNGNEWISLSQKVLIPPVHYFDFRSSYDEIIVGSLCIVIDGDLDNIAYTDFIPYDEFDDYIKKCDLLITHGGVGSIITGLKNGKKVIAAPRLSEYGEHTNDHQLQIIDNFSENGYILGLYDFDKLDEILKESINFKPRKYKSNTKNMIKLIEEYIDNE